MFTDRRCFIDGLLCHEPCISIRVVGESPETLRHVVILGDSLAVSPSNTDNFPTALQKRLDAEGTAGGS